ncbi:swi5-dependent recombination DNA repair protein 1 homolog [Hippoglossus hippoglossus]|uniref:swi5-dependent recombination DNA repair protein 1 homolog n=1 Tax=Hippoglossus hippoglossus TaxID=8267 RepID=UPI00148D8169|nr:swi5-dependent recombination DNA repair protein 1 homolog [Hippoglossus hippoglossus]XP_034464321.1 swi5-dependent recombination DNA repair protein 1 homolog [Hippoglossus hippoglossus]
MRRSIPPMEITPRAAAKVKSVYLSPCDSVESSPGEDKQEKPHQKLSSSLRERLKRSRRSFTSPSSVAKRLCVDDDSEEGGRHVSADSQKTVNNPPLITVRNVDVNRKDTRSGSERFSGPIPEPGHAPSKDLAQQRDQLRKEVKDKMETLRRLKLVKMYRSKNDLTQLQTLIDKWRSCAQDALCKLQPDVLIEGQKGSLSQLIDLFGLEDGILHFDRTSEDFTF